MNINTKLTQEEIDQYYELIGQGYSQRQCCSIMGISRGIIQHYLKRVFSQLDAEEEEINSLVNSRNGESCGYFEPRSKSEEKPKILFYDIETTLAKSYHFGQWKQNLSVKQQVEEGHLLSHAWAWGDDKVVGSILTRDEVLAHDPERLVLEAWSLLDNADIVVAHYGKKFDIPKLNGYFLKYGLNPPSPYKVIDTKEISSKKFLLPFNSLEYLAKALGVQQKIDNSGIQLWIDCDKGKQEALDEMLLYNIGDIEALRDVYHRLITWDNNGVNLALYSDHGMTCNHCGSDNIVPIDGKFAYTVARKYSLYRCNSCQAVLRSNTKEGNGNKLVRVV